jgi:hypothetical protein
LLLPYVAFNKAVMSLLGGPIGVPSVGAAVLSQAPPVW